MKMTCLAAAVLAISAATGARAQTATAPQPSPEKLAVAQQMLEVSGGQKQMAATMSAMYAAMFTSINQNLPPEQQRLTALVQKDFQAGMLSLIPAIMDSGARVYATDLTDKELRDYIAFQESDTGRSIRERRR